MTTSENKVGLHVVGRRHDIVAMAIDSRVTLVRVLFDELGLALTIIVPDMKFAVPTDSDEMSHFLELIQIMHSDQLRVFTFLFLLARVLALFSQQVLQRMTVGEVPDLD